MERIEKNAFDIIMAIIETREDKWTKYLQKRTPNGFHIKLNHLKMLDIDL